MRQIWVGCILLSTAVSSTAVTLGRHFGAAVIGRPLDIRVQMFLAPGEDMGGLCIGSDVFYGDSQVSGSQVRSTLQKSATEAEGYVRVQSLQAVNEPIVTIYVRASCTAPFTRRYVLLADPITEPSAQPAPLSGLTTEGRFAEGSRVSPERLPSVIKDPVVDAILPTPTNSEPAPVARVTEQPVVRPSNPKPPSVVRRSVAPAPTSRLQLEPIDLGPAIESDPVLKMSISMLSEPSASEETRAAAALLWKAINASPEEVLKDSQKLSQFESESKSLRDADTMSQAAIAELRSDLATAQKEKYSNWLVYLLSGGLLVALAGMGALWRRRSEVSANDITKIWWASEIKPKKEGLRRKSASAPLDAKSELVSEQVQPLGSDKSEDYLDSDSLVVPDSGFPFGSSSPVPPLPEKDKREFAQSSTLGASRSVATEELFDVQQKADFFTSLGKDDEAIQVLLSHLNERQEPCALTYLDLLSIYHRLGRNVEYERLREEFNQVFNAGVPTFEHYSDVSQSLDAYESAFARIQALWPQPRVLDLIEQSIFRDSHATDTEVFDLEAYRELLLLHAIAKDIIKREVESPGAPLEFHHTALQPLKAQQKPHSKATRSYEATSRNNVEILESDIGPPASPRLGLDIDLNEFYKESSFAVLLPEDQNLEKTTAYTHLETLPRAVRSAPLREPSPHIVETFDLMFEEQELPPRKVPAKGPSE